MAQKPVIHGADHLPGHADPIPGLVLDETFDPFYDAIADLAPTRDLRGYWRLGEGGFGPYLDTSGYVGGPSPMTRVNNTVDMSDVTGALPTADDDGAVQFNSSTGLTSDYLLAANHWGAAISNPFEGDIGTVAGWVKPFASASTFDGGIFTMLSNIGVLVGYVLGVEWPSRRIFHQRQATRLYGPVLAADEWVFAAGVKDGTSTRIYLNGALVATGAAVDGTPGTNIEPKIGFWNHSGTSTTYGAIDEVSVWGDALTDSEIAILAGAGGLAEDEDVLTIVAVSGTHTALPGEVVLATGTITITLPTAVGNNGTEITVKNVGVGTVTVARPAGETIDGAASNTSLTVANSSRTYVSDGTGWQIIGSYL